MAFIFRRKYDNDQSGVDIKLARFIKLNFLAIKMGC